PVAVRLGHAREPADVAGGGRVVLRLVLGAVRRVARGRRAPPRRGAVRDVGRIPDRRGGPPVAAPHRRSAAPPRRAAHAVRGPGRGALTSAGPRSLPRWTRKPSSTT